MHLKNTNALHFLWRANSQDDIKDYVMLVHVFSKANSPCCANRALQKTRPKNLPMSNKQLKGTFA